MVPYQKFLTLTKAKGRRIPSVKEIVKTSWQPSGTTLSTLISIRLVT